MSIGLNMNIIFLDFDGVLMPGRIWAMNKEVTGSGLMKLLDPIAVHQLNKIWSDLEGNLNLVISSSQQTLFEYLSMISFLRVQGLKIPLNQKWCTGHRGADARHQVIQEYISQNNVESYAVLDDIDMTAHFGDRMVLTDYNDGLLTKHFDQIRTIFNIEKPLILF